MPLNTPTSTHGGARLRLRPSRPAGAQTRTASRGFILYKVHSMSQPWPTERVSAPKPKLPRPRPIQYDSRASRAPTDNSPLSLGHHSPAALLSPTYRSRITSRQSSSLGPRLLTTSPARPGPRSAARAPIDPPIDPPAIPQLPPARCTALAHPILSPS